MSYAIKLVRYNYLVGPFQHKSDAAEYRFRHCFKEDEIYAMYPPMSDWRERGGKEHVESDGRNLRRVLLGAGNLLLLLIVANMLFGCS